MSKRPSHDATDSSLGFYYQACYALIILLDAGDSDAVSVETEDDVVLIGKDVRLEQLKHSLAPTSHLTEKNDGLWNTIGHWLDRPPAGGHFFVFVTCQTISPSSRLKSLTVRGAARASVAQLLSDEATRVIALVRTSKRGNSTGTQGRRKVTRKYKKRIGPCEKFMKLTLAERTAFLDRVTIIDGNFNATVLNSEVQQRLLNYRKSTRASLAERLLEWWNRRVARSFTKELPRIIGKQELLEHLFEFSLELHDDLLPDNFSTTTPDSLATEFGTAMEYQIELVEGGAARLHRAALARWRARNQRNKWITENLAVASDLVDFDAGLIECWQNRHGPMCDDCAREEAANSVQATRGLALLDWAHYQAAGEVPALRRSWNKPFLTQGTYQQLADELRVGWHPNYKGLMESILSRGTAAPSSAMATAAGD